MARTKNEKRWVKGELTGKPVTVDGVTVTPVARMDGLLVRGPEMEGEYQAGFIRIKPVRAIIKNHAGEEKSLAIGDIHGDIGRNMTIAGALLAVLAVVITIVRKLK